jgi:outer membrane protein OmpA-like peptidoglycan-associated protein
VNTRSLTLLKSLTAGAAVAMLAGCATAPETNAQLEAASTAYRSAASDAQVARSAPVELRRAEDALRRGENALSAGADVQTVEHFAFLAQRRTAIAVERAKLATAEDAIERAGLERDRVLIEARTREADSALNRAEAAKAAAEQARLQAESAQQLAEKRLKDAEGEGGAERDAKEREKKRKEQIAQLQARKTDRGLVLTLGDVLFDTGESVLKPGAMRTLDQLAEFLRDNASRKVMIEGHTDSVGSDVYNQRLSEDRADSVRMGLLDRNIVADRILVRGFGKSYPVASNDSPEGRQRNRRVEVIISDESGTISERMR